MIWITADDVIALHSRVIQTSGGIDGLRDRAGLEAAIAAPLQAFGGQDLFPSMLEKIARLGYGLAANHAFIDGNKRIGAMMTQLLVSSRRCLSPLQMVAQMRRHYCCGCRSILIKAQGGFPLALFFSPP